MGAESRIRTSVDFGYRMREERERRGITQAALAARADVSIRWLSNFERGKAPRAELIKVMHVARALGLAFELAPDARPVLDETQQGILDSVRRSLPTTAVAPELAQMLGTIGDHVKRGAGDDDGEA